VITEHAMREFRFTATTAGWLIQAPGGLTATQITTATQTAATAGASIETVNSIPSLAQITDAATIFAMVLALGILAMSIGLVRSETASDLRTLTATGASSTARRTLTAATAGALALTGAVVGTAGGYLAAIGFFRTNQLDQLSELASVPVADLLWILVGLPLIAVVVSWLLAGREPRVIARQPLE
jgi:putative ABC transport system permease protein